MGLLDRIRDHEAPRVAFLGIDGVPFSLIADNADLLPNLAAIAEEGSAGAIDSIVPPESSAAWPALTAGVNPGKTGVYGFQDRETGSYETYVPMGRDVRHERIWDRVSAAGRDATVLNVPITFPPQRNVQRMVSGFLSPEVEAAAHPASFRRTLEELDYRIDVDAKLGHREDKSAFLEDAQETLERRQAAFEHCIDADDWDLFFGVYMTPDRVNHFCYEAYAENELGRQSFLEFYEQLDEYVGAIRERLPDDVTLVVASDHGFTTLSYDVYCNEWLAETGWLEYDADDPDELADIADETRAYSLAPGRFYLNLEGREPRGSVPEADYERVRAELRRDLEALEGPDGTAVLDRVVDGEEAFSGDTDERSPDLVAIPNDGFDLKAGFERKERVFDDDTPRTGMHTFGDATLLIDEPGVDVEGADILDVTPTILELLGMEVDPEEFDGESLL
ncbi:alkaline phosphatase family protein [Haloparvum sp. PAK95]|uniref:alkaline phosphatase family protein n=1 Tax=Haloparvum sp. PAK95 TaxID=3418962 RepID=UPI003D2EB0E4